MEDTSLYNNPLYPTEDRLEMALGGIDFRGRIIVNLRQQLVNLRAALEQSGLTTTDIDSIQYSHLNT